MNSRAEARDDEILPNGRIMRYEFRERLMHWMNGFSYLYLMLTGLSFWSPWLLWIAVVLGGTQISRMLHPWIGLFFSFVFIVAGGSIIELSVLVIFFQVSGIILPAIFTSINFSSDSFTSLMLSSFTKR